MSLTKLALTLSAIGLSAHALAFSPTQSDACKALTQDLLAEARSKTEKKIIRIFPAGKDHGPGEIKADGRIMPLRQAILNAPADSTLLLAKGFYKLPESQAEKQYTGLYLRNNNITLIGDSTDPADIIIDGAYQDLGQTAGVLSIEGSNATIANLTLTRSIFHLMHLWKGADNITVHNVHFIDGGQQFLKSSPGQGAIEGGAVRCSQFLMTETGRDNVWGYGKANGWTTCYTGGIDTHNTHNWLISDNRFEGIYCNASGVARPAHQGKPELRNHQTYTGGLSEHAIHMWNSKKGSEHIIKNNQIINCARGIGIGLKDSVYGGLVMNNMIVNTFPGSREQDVGIAIYNSAGAKIFNNTVFFSHKRSYPNTIEIIHAGDKSTHMTNSVTNNLTNRMIRLRSGGRASMLSNVHTASADWFVNAEKGDLHLASCPKAPLVIASGSSLDAVSVDIDDAPRAFIYHIGADQCAEGT